MATYKGIQGYRVQKLSSDPTAAEAVGQLWYNSTSGAFKIATQTAGAWSSGGALNTARDKLCEGGCGAQDTAFIAGGNTTEDKTEQYDGDSWTQAPVLNSGRNSGGMTGTPASALFFGGQPGNQDITEYFNGSAWAETADLNTGRLRVGSAGTSAPATLAYGGGPPYQDVTEMWDGTSWSNKNPLNTPKIMFGCGSSTAAIGAGGEIPVSPWRTTNTEKWDGTSWAETANLNTAVNFNGMAGSQTAALSFGGAAPGPTTATELWDGTSWSTQNVLATARSEMAPAGSATAALGTGGGPGSGAVTTTEEWADPVYTIKTVTVS